jgi:hypothetical protein
MRSALCALVAVLVALGLQGCASILGFDVRFGVPRQFWTNTTTGPDRCDTGPMIDRR